MQGERARTALAVPTRAVRIELAAFVTLQDVHLREVPTTCAWWGVCTKCALSGTTRARCPAYVYRATSTCSVFPIVQPARSFGVRRCTSS